MPKKVNGKEEDRLQKKLVEIDDDATPDTTENNSIDLKRDNSLIVKADELILSDFSMTDSLSAYRIVNNENKYYVLLKPPYCSCLYFLEFGICKHFICLCKLLNYYSDDNVREFVYVKKKGDQLNQKMIFLLCEKNSNKKKSYPCNVKADSDV
ncbi:hypothetical protein BpHYR1_001133 [Brachionus plicatilis]|uniref:SWIM-type domain-containing protein n=1 Tax=Brachionus plicatilis TaxID=10195 RepID=A0A3M7T0F4_BRAPC|nr:hypothetical protein BpHYR1_001133 [Brachionus plicatilis]